MEPRGYRRDFARDLFEKGAVNETRTPAKAGRIADFARKSRTATIAAA
jgi:hypothetical protein